VSGVPDVPDMTNVTTVTALADDVTDPYFPERGNEGYRVEHYDLWMEYRVGPNRLAATARLTVVATEALDALSLDLAALRVDAVMVETARARFEHRGEKLRITLPSRIPAGARFWIDVRYGGRPRPTSSRFGGLGWEQLADGVLVAGQPTGAPSWFPCDDRPDRKATYRFEITTSAAYHVAATGVLARTAPHGSNTTWIYEQEAPMATYLASVQIGRYQVIDLPGQVRQRLAVPMRRAAAAREAFAAQEAIMELFCGLFGPYPFDDYTVVVTDDSLEIPVEAQGMSIFGSNHLGRTWESRRLVAHELAHQWFGNSLTLADWRDIWLHEGFAAYAEWLWSQASGRDSADEHARRWHRSLSRMPQDLRLSDPGPADLFDDRVYKRGALTLHALRLTVGETAFFRILRRWTAVHRHSSVRTAQFIALVEAEAGRSMTDFFTAWLDALKLPDLPGAAG
jgi:aminopeptidase N